MIEIVEITAWPAKGIENYRCIEDGKWGYLTLYSDGSFNFDDSKTPSTEEILKRWGFHLTDAK